MESQPRLSRRKVLFGLAGLTVAGGGMVGLGVKALARLFTYPTVLVYRGHADLVEAVSWASDGKRIASASGDGTVQIWDALTGARLLTYRGHATIALDVVWSPDGKQIASAGFTREMGSDSSGVHIWNPNNGQDFLAIPNSGAGESDALVWSPYGTMVAAASGEGVQVFDASSGTLLLTHSPKDTLFKNVAWSPDGTRLASGGSNIDAETAPIEVWDARTSKTLLTYHGHDVGVFPAVKTIAWSPDSQRIVSGGSDGVVQVWDASSGKRLFAYQGHHQSSYGYIRAVAWSPDGQRIASSGDDATVQVWNAATGETLIVYSQHAPQSVFSLAWSPDGTRIASGGGDKTVRVWRAE
ncbi:MAG TPA: WD40 repeat domain-containing protein [Ktedonobacterales bacterium]|jgi:WD40 repeat protein